MGMKALISPNSFKNCAESIQIAEILSEELVKHNLKTKVLPLSDGGDGFLSSYNYKFKYNQLTYHIYDDYSLHFKKYIVLYCASDRKIFIESANLFGLKVFNKIDLNPLRVNSSTLGKLLKRINDDIKNKKIIVDEVIIGIGGTATIDFAIGAMTELGLTLCDISNKKVDPAPENFKRVKSASFRKIKLLFKISCIVDVNTKLFGNSGAIKIYGKQKGASINDLVKINNGLMNLTKIFNRDFKKIKIEELNGAGGGLKAGLKYFYNAKIISAKYFIKKYYLNEIKRYKFDTVITGEGHFDSQSFEGKIPGLIIDMFKNTKIPVFLICGKIDLPKSVKLPDNVIPLSLEGYFNDQYESIKKYKIGLKRAARFVCKALKNQVFTC